MAKSSSRKSLKSLFSRSEANLRDSEARDVDKNEGEKKRFRFFRFKRKSNSSVSVKPGETQQVFLSPDKEDAEAWAENNLSDNKKTSLYATAPRSKGKELSYSEMDLRKPNKFATFSFGLKRRKKRDEEGLSKSAFGLHSTEIEEQEEPPPDLSQMELDKAIKKTISRSQPVIDASNKFEIPSPPPVAPNQSDSYFALPEPSKSSVAINTQPEAKTPLTNGSNFLDIHTEPLRAPIATIPELQMDSSDVSDEKENIPVRDNLAKSDACSPALVTQTEPTSAIDEQTLPTLQANRPPMRLDTADLKAAVVDLVSPTNGLSGNDSLLNTKKETSPEESSRVTLPNRQPYAPDTANRTTLNAKPSLAGVDSNIDSTATETTPNPATADFSSVLQEVSVYNTERAIPKIADSATTTSTVSAEKSTDPVNQNKVYGDLYESLFPQSFTSEVMSSLSNPPPQIRTEIRHLNTESEPVMVKTFDECRTERSALYSSLSTSYSANMNPTFSEIMVTPSSENYKLTSYEISTTYELQRDPDINYRYLTSSLSSKPADSYTVPYSELTRSLSEVKSDSAGLIQDTVTPALVMQSSAPPVSDYVTSQGTDTQVTDPKRRVILVKELVTDEVSSVPGCTSLGLEEKMDSAKDLELKIETARNFSAVPPGQMSGYEGPTSPTYLSVGSDVSSAIDIYYSAEEDNIQDSVDEEVFNMDKKEEIRLVDRAKEVVGLQAEYPQKREMAETDIGKKDEAGVRVEIVKLQNERTHDEKNEDIRSRTEVYQQSSDTWTSGFLKDKNAKTYEKEVTTTVLPKEAEEVKEVVGLGEEFSKQGEITERDKSQTDEGGLRVVIVKMRSEESNDELSRTEVYQQSSETLTSRFIGGNYLNSPEKEVAITTLSRATEDVKEVVGLREEYSEQGKIEERQLSQTDEGGLRVVILKMQNEGTNDAKVEDTHSQTEVYQQSSERWTSRLLEDSGVKSQEKEVAKQAKEEVKDLTEYIGDFSKMGEIAEKETSKRDEGGKRVVIVKLSNEGGDEDKREDVSSQTGEPEQLRGQSSENWTSKILVGNDTKIQEKEEVTQVFPEVAEEVKEVIGLLQDFSTQGEIAGKEISKRDDDGMKLVIVKTNNDTKIEDVGSQTGEPQQLSGQSSENWTSEILESNDTKIQEREEATQVFPRVEEEAKEVIGLLPEFSTQGEIAEKEISKRDEDGMKVVIVKLNNDAKIEDASSRTEEPQQLRGQSSENWTSENPHSNDAQTQKKEVPTPVFSRVEEHLKEFKEVIGLREDFPKTVEIAEKEIIKSDVGSKEEKRDEMSCQTEVQHHLKLQSSETSGFLEANDAKIQEKTEATKAFPEVTEEVKEVVEVLEGFSKQREIAEKEILKRDEEGKDEKREEISKPAEVQQQLRLHSSHTWTSTMLKGKDAKTQEEALAEEVAFPEVAEEVKEVVGLLEEFSKQGEIAEKEISKRDEEVKEEKKEEIRQTKVQKHLRGQCSETTTTEILRGNDAKTQEEEKATAAFPQVKEEGREERKEELPATPVGQVKTLMVCDFAPPSSKQHGSGEGSERNRTEELETEAHPNGKQQLPSQEVQYVAFKDVSSSVHIHAASSNMSTEKERITPLFKEANEQVSLLAEANMRVKVSTDSTETTSSSTTSALTDTSGAVEVVTSSTELQSNATGIEHNRAPQSKTEWADSITQSTDPNRTVQEQVAVELSALNEDTHLPDTQVADAHSERREQPADTKPDLNEGSLTVSRALKAASDILTSENHPADVDKDSDNKMTSSYSSLSTKLTLKTSSPPKEDESRYRVHKMSLIGESDTTEDTVDSTVTDSNGSEQDSEYKWRNRFEGVSQYKPSTTEEFSYSNSLSNTDTYSSPSSLSSSSYTLPEATAYKHAGNAFYSSSSSFSPSSEEHITLSNRLSDRSEVYLSRESEPAGEREEPAAPAGEREREGESERFRSSWESHQSPASGSFSPKRTSYDRPDSFKEEDDDSTRFTGVFKATLVELVSDAAAPPSTPPTSPDADSLHQFDMDSLVDTLKSMGPSMRPRSIGPRAPAPVLVSSLPPIVEDASSPVSLDVRDSNGSLLKKMEAANKPTESLNGLYTLPADLGLKRNSRDSRSPLELMKQSQQENLINSPQRATAANGIVMRRSSDSTLEDLQSPLLNGNGGLPSPSTTSRLDNSVIFGSYRSGSIDQKQENKQAHRPLFRTGSLPDTPLSNDRMSVVKKDSSELSTGADQTGSRFERFSFLLNNSPSASGSLTGAEDPNMRMSRPTSLGIISPPSSNSPNRVLSPTGSIDLQRSLSTPDSPLSMYSQNQGMGMGMGMGMGGGISTTPLLQRSFSNEGTMGVQQTSLFNSVYGGSQFQNQEQEKNLASKYRAFPDAYLTKEKEHGKLNPRPGKMYIFDQPGMCGQRIEICSDVIDATSWELQETISIRVVRGGWVLYEMPNFKGDKIALDEGDIELTFPFGPPEEQLQNGVQEGENQNGEQNGETSDVQTENEPPKRFIIGSLRRAVRDYSVPEISLFPEENAEGKKVIFRDTSDDARIFGFPIKATSIIINAGLWLVYAHPFFQGVPRVLEVGGFPNPAAWGVEKPYVGSLHPLKVGEPRVENLSEPKIVIYDKPYFSGKSRTITTNMRDFMTREDRQQTAFMYSVGSLKVQGGIWVGYEKEGFRGHQYLLEEGEYQDWRVWGGCDSELRSARVIRASLTEPMMVMFEQPEEDQEGMQEDNTFEVTEAIPDVELFEYKTSTRSIEVVSGAWVAYSHVDFSGHQYILEKGFYNNCADWGSQDNRICSVQPILLAPSDCTRTSNEVILYTEPDFKGECHVLDRNQEALPEKLSTKSCRVSGGSWAFYEDQKFSGNLYVLSEGDYPNLTSMGCPPSTKIQSVKVVPLTFSVPSISLFGLECLEGREITIDTEILSMVEEGFNNHILSVRVNSGCWVICEHSNYRGRQFLMEPIEITNWPKFSSLQTIGSMFPVRQKRHFFRIKNKERGHYLSIQGGVEEMKSGRVVVTPEVEGMTDIWFYQDGFIKSKMSQTMSLQVMGNVEPASKVVLWSETRQPIQTWTAKMRGLITSLTFLGMVLDIKGGKTYDKDHVVIMPESEERPSQQWEIELL
ncbi:uncharacterized protein crybg2 [Tautogolabrus adspersus]